MSDSSSPPRETIIRAAYPSVEFRDASETDLGPGYLGLLRILFSPVNEWTEIKSAWEGNFMERFAPGAWKKTIRERASKIRALFQHGMDPQIGDKPLGPIRLLEENERGGYAEVALLDTSYNRDLLPGLKESPSLYGASHRFSVMREEEVTSPEPSEGNPHGLPERTIKEAQLLEMGPVTFPAYQGATAGVRSMTDEFLMSCFRSDPDRLREMFTRATDLEVGKAAAVIVASADGIGSKTYADYAQARQHAADVMQGEQDSELRADAPDEQDTQDQQEQEDAPSSTDAAPERTSEPERRVTVSTHSGPLTLPTSNPQVGLTLTTERKANQWPIP